MVGFLGINEFIDILYIDEVNPNLKKPYEGHKNISIGVLIF
jgi:hypothetical protein